MLRIRLVGELRLDLDGRRLDADREPPGAVAAGVAGVPPRAAPAQRAWRRCSGPTSSTSSARASLRTTLADAAPEPRGGGRAAASSPAATASASRTARTSGSTCGRSAASPPRAGTTRRWRSATATCSPTWTTTGCSRSGRRTATASSSSSRSLGDAAEEAGDLEAAVQHARRRLELDPVSEDAARVLMRRLARAGDGAAAVAAYEAFRAALRRELGMAPSAETRALAERAALRARSAASAAARRCRCRPRSPAASTRPLVGRDEQLAALRAAWRAGERGRRRRRGARRRGGQRQDAPAHRAGGRGARRDGATVLAGRCIEDGVVAVRALHRGAAPVRRRPTRRRCPTGSSAELARLLPELGPGPGPPEGEPQDARHRLFEAVAAAVGHAARRTPGAAGRRGPALGGPADAADARPRRSGRWAGRRCSSPARCATSAEAARASTRCSTTCGASGASSASRSAGCREGEVGELAAAWLGSAPSAGPRGGGAPAHGRQPALRRGARRATSSSRTPAGRPRRWSRRRGARCRTGVRSVIDRRARAPRRAAPAQAVRARGGRRRGLRARRRRRRLRGSATTRLADAPRRGGRRRARRRVGASPGATASPTRWSARRCSPG